MMEIEFPKRYWLYLGMLVDAGYYASRPEAAAAIFHQGLDDVLEDLMISGDYLMDESFLTGARLRLEIPDRPPWRPFSGSHDSTSSEWLSVLCETLCLSPNEASAIAFVYGLSGAYAQLAESPRYRAGSRFKALINRLPHYVEDDPEEWAAVQAEAGILADESTESEAEDLDALPPGVTLDTMSREELDAWVDQQLRLESEEGR